MTTTNRAAQSFTISGGTVLTPAGSIEADVVVGDGRIRALVEPGGSTTPGSVNASGCLVLPGGVDPHAHVMSDIGAATRAAALGGTTTVLSFTNPEPGEGALDCLVRRRAGLLDGGATVDVGLHAMLFEPDHVSVAELEALRDAGACGIKVFLAYPELGIMWSERGLFELMTAAARLHQVVQVHCEEGELIEGLVAEALASRRTGPRVFADTRPPQAEACAVARVLATAKVTGARCYLTHLSCSGSLEQVRLARRTGTKWIRAEVCLHHLLLDDSVYDAEDAERYLVAPPLRSREDREWLWEALADWTVDTVGSDHSQKRSDTIGEIAPDGRGYSYGLAGIGARLPILLSRGLARGLPVERTVQLAATGPARAFGIYPRKGAIIPGADADIVIWDPIPEETLQPGTFDDGTGDSVYAGEQIRGKVRDVFLRGTAIVRDGAHIGTVTPGEHVGGKLLQPHRHARSRA